MATTMTIEEVESLTAMHLHELEGLDALFPKLLETTVEQVSARFQESNTATSKKHIAALVAVRLYARLGTRSPDTQFHIEAAASEAEAFLAKAAQSALAPRTATLPPRPDTSKDSHG